MRSMVERASPPARELSAKPSEEAFPSAAPSLAPSTAFGGPPPPSPSDGGGIRPIQH